MKKLLLSQDMNACTCHFREEQAFLSALPLVAMEKKLYERGKRNLLTGGAASCYPFPSYEMCDDNGILLGVNKYNSTLMVLFEAGTFTAFSKETFFQYSLGRQVSTCMSQPLKKKFSAKQHGTKI